MSLSLRSKTFCNPLRVVALSSVTAPLASPAVALFHDRLFETARPDVQRSFLGRLLLTVGGYYGKESRRRRGANNLYDAIVEQAENAAFYKRMELRRDSFGDVHNVLGLHVWLLIQRLSGEEDRNAKKLIQNVYDLFLHDVDMRVHKAGVRVRVSQRLEDLERRFYGRSLAYDQALDASKGETLAQALLRNVYDDDKKKVSASMVLERYVKRETECLRITETVAVVQGQIKFTCFS